MSVFTPPSVAARLPGLPALEELRSGGALAPPERPGEPPPADRGRAGDALGGRAGGGRTVGRIRRLSAAQALVAWASLAPAAVALSTVAGCPSPGVPGDGIDTPFSDAGEDGVGLDGGPGGAGVDGGAVVSAEAYCESIVDFFCRFYLRCGRIVAANDEECRATFLETCEQVYEPRYRALDEAGLLRLSEEGVAGCRAHLDEVACEKQVKDLDGPCAAMWEGQVEAGGACGFDFETFVCASGTTCVVGLDLCGTCQTTVATGAACGSELRCAPEDECADGVCQPRVVPGEPCVEGGARCVLGASCVDGVCQGPSYVEVGEACDNANRCPYRSACIGGSCVLSGLLGQSCAPNGPVCASGRCADEGDDAGQCVELLADGEPCGPGECRSGRCEAGVCRAGPSGCFGAGG